MRLIFTFSAAIGALMAGQIADWLGRKNTIAIALLGSYASVTLEFVATTNPVFFVGKLLNGLVVGTRKYISLLWRAIMPASNLN